METSIKIFFTILVISLINIVASFHNWLFQAIVFEVLITCVIGIFKADQIAQSFFEGPEYTSELDSKTITSTKDKSCN